MTPEEWSALANVVIAIAALAASVAAFLGLDRWKKQGLWHSDTDLARRALIAVYHYRDSLYAVRHPAMSNSEMKLDEEEAASVPENQLRNQQTIVAYSRRWKKHSETRNLLSAILIETDAIWGNELSQHIEKLFHLEHELFVYIHLHLDAHFRGGDPELAKAYREILRKKRDVLYDLLSDEDEFRQDFSKSLIPVEEYLKKKLGRKKA